MSDEVYQRAVALMEGAGTVLITTHTRPDGDACGCVAALTEVLKGLGKTVRPLLLSGMPDWYEFLFDEKIPVLGEDVRVEELASGPFGNVDLVVILDTNSYSQLPQFEDYLRQNQPPVLVIDHHVTSDHLGRVEIVDTTAAAAGLLLLDFLRYSGWPVTKRAAEALFVGIATDTGWFHLRNTDSRVFRGCADLIERGVDPNDLYRKLYEGFSPARFQLMVAMLNTLELHCDGRYASQYLVRADFERTGAAYRDTENLVNECQRIGAVKVAALFVELRDGRIRCSLRSRPDARPPRRAAALRDGGPVDGMGRPIAPGAEDGDAVDVNAIAHKFGGGGHRMAAGTYLPAPLEHAMQLIFDEVAQRLD